MPTARSQPSVGGAMAAAEERPAGVHADRTIRAMNMASVSDS